MARSVAVRCREADLHDGGRRCHVVRSWEALLAEAVLEAPTSLSVGAVNWGNLGLAEMGKLCKCSVNERTFGCSRE